MCQTGLRDSSRRGDITLEDGARSGKPAIVDNKIKAMVKVNLHMTTQAIAEILKISRSSSQSFNEA